MRLLVIGPDGFDVHRVECRHCDGAGFTSAGECDPCDGLGHVPPIACPCDHCIDEREFRAEEPA